MLSLLIELKMGDKIFKNNIWEFYFSESLFYFIQWTSRGDMFSMRLC